MIYKQVIKRTSGVLALPLSPEFKFANIFQEETSMLICHIKPPGITATDSESITEISLSGQIYNPYLLNVDTRRVQSTIHDAQQRSV